jgi:small subunit ribosomal protein S18
MARPDMGGSKMGNGSFGGPRSGGFGGGGGGGFGRGGDRGDRGDRDGEEGGGRRGFGRRKVCRFCADKALKVDYKDQGQMKYFLTERGKIIPRRISGNCAKHQREVATAVKRGRMLAILPYTVGQM